MNFETLDPITSQIRNDPEFASLVRNYFKVKLHPPLRTQPEFDTIKAPLLPEWAALSQTGFGAGAWIDEYIRYARSVSPMTPISFHESAALWLGSVAIARRLVLTMPFGDIYPNLFIIWLANTTLYRKSTALNVARDLVQDTFPFLLAAQDTTPEAFLSDLSGLQPNNFCNLPLLDQQAWEKERNFSAQRGWVLDELSGLMAGAGKDYNAGLLESLIRFYDCDSMFTRSTISRGRIVVKNAYLCLLGASTPAALAGHFTAESLWSGGWWPRFAILTPEGRPAWQDATATERPASIHDKLFRLFNRLPNDTKWPESPKTKKVILGANVFETWSKYNKALSYDLLTEDLPRQLWGSYGRLPVLALKVAMILAAVDWPSQEATPTIDMAHLARAIGISETWRESAHRALTTTAETDFNRTAERVLKVIAKYEPEGATKRDICRAMRDKRPAEIQMAIDEMLTAGMIEMAKCDSSNKVGRPAERYVTIKE